MRWAPRWIVLGWCGLCCMVLASCRGETTTDLASPAEYQPTPPRSGQVGERLVGPIVYTIDARARDLWMYFDFSRGAVVPVQHPKTGEWDLAFRRHVIRTNGGDTNPSGQGALFGIETEDFAAVTRVPVDAAFVSDVRTKKRLWPYNPVVEKWYHYSYTVNVLTPKPMVYIVRTQNGKYAKLRILSYYCKGDVGGCMTFEYVYQGDGSTNLAAPPTKASHHLEQSMQTDGLSCLTPPGRRWCTGHTSDRWPQPAGGPLHADTAAYRSAAVDRLVRAGRLPSRPRLQTSETAAS